MADSQIIQVRLPEGAPAASEDIDLLRGIFEAIVALRFSGGGYDSAAETALTGDGWSVRTRLRWVAEATKGGEFEQVTGMSKSDAMEHLLQLVKADRVLSAL